MQEKCEYKNLKKKCISFDAYSVHQELLENNVAVPCSVAIKTLESFNKPITPQTKTIYFILTEHNIYTNKSHLPPNARDFQVAKRYIFKL